MHGSWTNPYIPLVQSSPLIAAVRKEACADELKERVRQKLGDFREVACELGSGAGRHLIAQAEQHPDTFWIGFELRYKRVFLTAQRAEKRGLNNLFVINSDLRTLFAIFEPETLSAIYVNFPDPWEKKRLRKHRIITTEFMRQCHSLLKPEGIFSFKSDHREYFDQAASTIQSLSEYRIDKLTFDLHKSEWNVGNITSEFEMLFASKGLPVFFLEAKKLGRIDS